MQVSRLGFWTQSVVAGLIAVSVATSAVAQRTRLSALERDFDDVLGNDGRRAPGLDLRGGNSLNKGAQVDLSKVQRWPLINLLKEAVAESKLLFTSVRDDSVRGPELQSSLREVTRLRDAADYAVQDLESGRELERMFPGIQKLNTDWRLLSHRLGQSPRISRKSLDIVDRIDRLERQMEQMFAVKTQLDRRALLTEFAGLASTLNNLLQELQYYDVRGNDQASEAIYEARKLGQQTQLIEDMVLDAATYDRIVQEYNRFITQWSRLLTDLRNIENRYVQRSIRNIVDSNSRIHDLLWLEHSANREHLHQLANSLIRYVDEFFNRTPLKLVMHLKNVDSILEKADNFYGTVRHFKQSVDYNDDDSTLLENYSYVEEYGTDFIRSFAQLRSSAGKVVLQEIESGIASLRAELNISGTVASVDTQKLITTAANLENQADHLKYDVNNWLERDREAYRDDALKAMEFFLQRCRRMHRLLQERPTLTQLRRESTDLNASWSSLYGYLTRCRTNDRAHMIDLAREINAALYKLESPVQL